MLSTQVLIIGAGPSGMVSALCLAKLGISCCVVERNQGIYQHPKAHELNTRSIEILRELGFTEEELAREASPPTDGARILFCNTINEELGRIDLDECQTRRDKYKQHLQSSRPYLNISQTELEKIILQKVRAHPLITIYFNHQWQSSKQREHVVQSDILDRLTGNSFSIQSDFVIAADGAGSRCRQSLNIQMEGPDNIQDFVSAYFEVNLRPHIKTPAKLYWIFNPAAPGIFIAHHIEKRWVYMLPIFLKHQKKEQFTKSFFADTIKTALGNQAIDIKVQSISYWRMSAQIASQYREGRVLLVGDAAHRFPPTGGLGMNTGIADAHNVCWKLAAILKGYAALELLDSYALERKPIARQNAEESLHNYHKILEVPEALGLNKNGIEKLAKLEATAPMKWLPKSIQQALMNGIHSWVGKKLRKIQNTSSLQIRVKNTIAEQLPHFDRIGLDIGYIYPQGALIPDGSTPPRPADKIMEYIPCTAPGARFPHVNLSNTKQFTSTHDLISYHHFTLITREAGQTWEQAYCQLTKQHSTNITLVQLHRLGLPAHTFEKLVTLFEIDADGILLIRPDGHVAFRAKSQSKSNLTLSQIFEQILYTKIEMDK